MAGFNSSTNIFVPARSLTDALRICNKCFRHMHFIFFTLHLIFELIYNLEFLWVAWRLLCLEDSAFRDILAFAFQVNS